MNLKKTFAMALVSAAFAMAQEAAPAAAPAQQAAPAETAPLQKPSLQQHLPLKLRLLPKLHSLPKRPLLQLPLQELQKLLPQKPRPPKPRLRLKWPSPFKNPLLLQPLQKLRSLQSPNRLPRRLMHPRVRKALPKACAWARPKHRLPSFTAALTIPSRTKPLATMSTFFWIAV